MADLSPAAQNIVNAAVESGGGYGRATPTLHARLAAALRVAADQIGPDGHDYSHGSIAELMWRGKREARRELLAIADELETAD
jgi:uncharacterized protein YjiS (DUF1127 family)